MFSYCRNVQSFHPLETQTTCRGIHFKFNGKQNQTIWMSQLKELYGDMHMLTGKKACEQINATDWNSLLADDVNKSWFNNCHH